MSLCHDWEADSQFERDFPFGIPQKNNPIWRTCSGDDVPVKNMNTSHILSCMKMVGEEDEWYHVFARELEKRSQGDKNAQSDT